MKLKNVAANLAVLLISTLVFGGLVFAAGELYFRLRTKADPRPFPWMVYHPARGWALQPGDYAHYDFNESSESHISINALGMRNPPLELAVPAGKRRVSVIGDSFVFGAALDQEKTIVGRLRERLGNGTEVVNLGVESYGNGQEAQFLEELHARGFDVGRTVVLVFFANDVMDNGAQPTTGGSLANSRPEFHVDSSGALQATRPVAGEGGRLWSYPIRYGPAFYHFLRTRLTNLVAANPWMINLAGKVGYRVKLPRTPGVVQGFYDGGWEERWDRTANILAYVDRMTREKLGARLVIAYVPSSFQVLEALQRVARRQSGQDSTYTTFLADLDRPQRLLGEICAREGIAFVDPTGALREASKKETPYFLYDAHLNAYGSQVYADALLAAIRDTAIAVAPAEAATRP
jgi:hypothetical protein